jgi:hypothetical protein
MPLAHREQGEHRLATGDIRHPDVHVIEPPDPESTNRHPPSYARPATPNA